MVRRVHNFGHIAVLSGTKNEVDDILGELKKKYPNATYEELIKVFLEKNKRITLTENEVRHIIAKSRGVI